MPGLPEPDEVWITDQNEAYTAGDEDIVLDDSVLELAAQMKAIECIPDEEERLEAARRWTEELNG